MPKQDVLKLCERAIRKNFKNLDDIPYELANTVANVYYKFFNHSLNAMKRRKNNPGWLPKEVNREPDIGNGVALFLKNSSRFMSDYEAVPKFIEGLREIDKYQKPNLYQFTVNYILDCLKYNIKDAHKKTELRRTIERKIRKVKVQEIPNLIDFLDV